MPFFARKQTEPGLGDVAAVRLAAIIESSDDAIVSKTLDGTILSWNTAAERIFGYSAAEMVRSSVYVLIPPELHAEERDHPAPERRDSNLHFTVDLPDP